MSFWLIKSDPEEYSWEQLLQDGEAVWDGIRNFQARNYLKEMKKGDRVFVYQTGDDKDIRGVAEVVEEAFPDTTAEHGEWMAVKVKPILSLVRPLQLEEIRNTHGLSVMPMVSQARLSVHPVTDAQAEAILKYSKTVLA